MLGGIHFRRFVAILASACVVAALVCNRAFSQDDRLSSDEAAVVKARVQKIRGLTLKHDVPVTYLSVAETEARFRTEFAKQITQEEIDTGLEENKMIGLFPPDLKFERKDLADMTLELAGFYDNHHKDIVIIDRPVTIALPERYRNALTEMKKIDTMGTLGTRADACAPGSALRYRGGAEKIQGQQRSRARLQGDRRGRRDAVGIFGGDRARR